MKPEWQYYKWPENSPMARQRAARLAAGEGNIRRKWGSDLVCRSYVWRDIEPTYDLVTLVTEPWLADEEENKW